MSNYDPHDPYHPGSSNIFAHAGFRYGFRGGIVMIAIHLFMLMIFTGTNNGDLLAWFISLFVYLMIGRVAAQSQYDSSNSRKGEIDPVAGISGAGLGAALVTSVMVWIFIVVRGIVRDAIGIFVLVDPIGLFCFMFVDILIAMGLGRWGARMIENKYQTFQGY